MDSNTAAKLQKVHPELAKRVGQLISVLAGLGLDVRAVQGLRTIAEQEALFAQGRTRPGKRVTNARGGQSNHNYGLAVDLCPFRNGQPDWNDTRGFQIIGREAKKLGLEWGGDWATIKDMPHVQLRGMSIKECQSFYKQGGLQHVWQRMNQILGGMPPTVFIPKEDQLIEFADKGPAVKNLQTNLAELGLLRKHEIDGEFGNITKTAVVAFQRQNGLTADGIVGPGTQAKLKAALSAKSETTPENVDAKIENLRASAAVPDNTQAKVQSEQSESSDKNSGERFEPEQPPINNQVSETLAVGSADATVKQTSIVDTFNAYGEKATEISTKVQTVSDTVSRVSGSSAAVTALTKGGGWLLMFWAVFRDNWELILIAGLLIAVAVWYWSKSKDRANERTIAALNK